jgi:hypothetical protein
VAFNGYGIPKVSDALDEHHRRETNHFQLKYTLVIRGSSLAAVFQSDTRSDNGQIGSLVLYDALNFVRLALNSKRYDQQKQDE